ncbi:aminodeoxychorismate lyase like protein [Teratosphaeria destructans]|uniref:Aminodeoxychorismate lyase like protein n=1 Tax=Teratosphaeria destructans TaxID=418781 RepID=A0A9W7VYY2_9PEZI|nr:aminodeoxychorismate lyase like protein [Teratosphaeria destructans]
MGRQESSQEPSGYAFDGSDEPFVFTTVRWDPTLEKSEHNTKASCNMLSPFYMLEHHWTRLQVVKWTFSIERSSPQELLHTLQKAVQQWHDRHPEQHPAALRIKHRVFKGGRSYTELMPSPALPLENLFPSTLGKPPSPTEPEWTASLDDQPTEASESTMFKTSDRACYERARRSAGINSFFELKEVLLYDPSGEVLDGSISTPYFWRDGRWVTPPSWVGGLQGTTRRWALEKKLCVEASVKKDDLEGDEMIWFSNAARGFFRAKFIGRDKIGDA